MEMRPRLIIIGGGYVGSAVARRLDGDLDVTLIEPKQAFVHTPAMIRALVQPGLTDHALLPYDPLLHRGRVIRDRVTGIGSGGAADHVMLASGDRVQGDLILIATGSGHAGFLKPLGDSITDFRALQSDTARRIASARHIVVVGAGPVGIEMAGEIAHAHPGKAVTLLSAHPALMPAFPPRLGRMLANKLAALGVTLHHGRAHLGDHAHPTNGPLLLTDGRSIDADLILPATGARGHCTLLDGLPGVRMMPGGRVATDAWLRPSDHPRLFVGGDIAATGDAMTIVATMRQIPYLVKTLRYVANGEDLHHRRPYRPWSRTWGKAPILLPLGPRRGASALPLPGPLAPFGIMGDLFTRQMKGRDLFVPKQRKDMGLA